MSYTFYGQQNQQYIASMRPVLRKNALFSDTTDSYVSPAEPAAYSEVINPLS